MEFSPVESSACRERMWIRLPLGSSAQPRPACAGDEIISDRFVFMSATSHANRQLNSGGNGSSFFAQQHISCLVQCAKFVRSDLRDSRPGRVPENSLGRCQHLPDARSRPGSSPARLGKLRRSAGRGSSAAATCPAAPAGECFCHGVSHCLVGQRAQMIFLKLKTHGSLPFAPAFQKRSMAM